MVSGRVVSSKRMIINEPVIETVNRPTHYSILTVMKHFITLM